MKYTKFIYILLAFIFTVGCTDDAKQSGFKLAQSEIEAPADGGTVSIAYTVANPDGSEVSVTQYPAWIHDFDTSEDGVITFTVDPNIDAEPRNADVSVSYGKASQIFTVKQAEAGEFALETYELSVAAEGGEMQVRYRANAGSTVSVSGATAQWVRDFDTSEEGVIVFVVDPNIGNSAREAKVEVVAKQSGAGELSKTLTVKQEAYVRGELPFALNIKNITTTTVVYDIVPEDKYVTYLSMAVEKSVFDAKFPTDESLFASDMEFFKFMAAATGSDFDTYLAKFLRKGVANDVVANELMPGTEYYVYVYATDGKELLSEVVKATIKTEDLPMVDMTFNIKIEAYETQADVMVIPSNQQYYYYFDVMRAQGITEDTDFQELCQGYLDYVFEYMQMTTGLPLADVVKQVCYLGIGVNAFTKLYADTEYVLFCMAIDMESGRVMSEAKVERFATKTIEPSDNQIALDYDSYFTTADAKITTTNDDPYVFIVDVAANYADGQMSDEEIQEYLLARMGDNLPKYIHNGNLSFTMDRRNPGTDYIGFAFGCVDGTVTTPLFKKSFRTNKAEEGTATMSLKHDKYFNAAEIEKAYPDKFGGITAKGNQVVLPLEVITDGPTEDGNFYYMIYDGDRTGGNWEPNSVAEDVMRVGCPKKNVDFFLRWGTWTLVGIARDADGLWGKIWMEAIEVNREGCSPVEEYAGLSETSSAPTNVAGVKAHPSFVFDVPVEVAASCNKASDTEKYNMSASRNVIKRYIAQ